MAVRRGRLISNTTTFFVQGNVTPAGTIQSFGGDMVPTGWLLCDGSIVSRITYSNLYAVVGDTNGNGNGTTTFHLPDLRGRVLRGADNMGTGAAGRDVGTRTASNIGGSTSGRGSVQDDSMQGHMHQLRFRFDGSPSSVTNSSYTIGSDTANFVYTNSAGAVASSISDGTNGTPKTAAETVEKNTNANFIIKY